MNEGEAPVSAGERHDVLINAVGEKGDGIARVQGFVIFVPNVKKGDFVKVKITKVLKNVGFAEVVEQLERSARKSKYETVSAEEAEEEPEEEYNYEDTEDFGEDEED